MAQSNYLKALVRAHAQGDDPAFREATERLIAEESRKGHRLVARDLRRLIDGGGAFAPAMPGPRRESVPMPVDEERGLPLAEVRRPRFGLERAVLREESAETLRVLVEDHAARDLFASYAIEPKRRVLFFGPPGCGKTLSAEALAGELGLPLLYVRFDSLISSYLGQTAANLRKLFDFAASASWVVLFDEFDALGRSRDDPGEHGELKRVINSILQLMDGFRGDSILIAATNHEQALDPALWRRFDEIMKFEAPDERGRQTMLRKFLAGLTVKENDLKVVASDTAGLTGSDLERVTTEAAKQMILAHRDAITLDDLLFGLKRQRQRIALAQTSEG